MPKTLVLFRWLGINWTLTKCLAVAGVFLMLVAAGLWLPAVCAADPLPGYTEEDGFKWCIDGIARCLPKAEECGVILALENHWGLTFSAAGLKRILDAFARVGARADDLVVGSLVFGVAFLSSRSGYSFSEALVASSASGLGYWLAEFLLESLRERLDLSDLPYPFKGALAMLISAGLMAMAFMGIDAVFIKNLAG